MDAQRVDTLARNIANNRIAGIVSDLLLSDICDDAEAYVLQRAATAAFTADVVGYTIVGTSSGARRSLGLDQPIFGTIAKGSLLRVNDAQFRLPQGFIGAQCEFIFTFGVISPDSDATDRNVLERSILSCQPGIGLLGRRTTLPPESSLGAIADYSLHVATICAQRPERLPLAELDKIIVRAYINGNDVAQACSSTVMGHPLNAVAWLVSQLRQEKSRLDVSDIIATGSCTPILQLLPGQRLDVDFGPVGRISCDFE